MKKIIFIGAHILLFIILYLLATFINYPYGYVCWIPIFCITALIYAILIPRHIRKYPLNDPDEYKINYMKFDYVDNENGIFIIKLINENGIYTTTSGNEHLRFDMTHCLFPKSCIRAIFIRNLQFKTYNLKKLPLKKFFWSIKLPKNYKIQNLKIEFKTKSKKTYWLVKKGCTKIGISTNLVLSSWFLIHSVPRTFSFTPKYQYLCEKTFTPEYWYIKKYNIRNPFFQDYFKKK